LPPADRARHWALAQHAPHEGPGLIAPALADAGVAIDTVRLDLGDELPAVEEVGGVVVMGGTMGVHDEAEFPWLVTERRWIADAVADGLPVLGVCLGAQQLAAALGAPVTGGPAPEIGTGEVALSAEGSADPVLGPDGPRLPAVHWHGDTFGIPDGAVRLASSDRYENQAFRYGHAVYGLQFHVEIDAALAALWSPELPPGCTLDDTALAAVEATGRRVLRRFVDLALDS
jgi:GMP synthase-like glutamine amidotransferase